MHEYSLVLSLLGRVESEVALHRAKAVHSVRVRLGELCGVEPSLFASAFEIAREGTACADASIQIEVVPARWSCPECGRDVTKGEALQCPDCGKGARLGQGGEILFDSMELEI